MTLSLAGCMTGTLGPFKEPTDTPVLHESTRMTSTPTTTSIAIPTEDIEWKENLDILVQYAVPNIGFGGYWQLPYPFESSNDLLQPSEEIAYCCLVQAPIGKKYAFIQRYLPDLLDSLWVMNSDGSDARQLRNDESGVSLAPGATEVEPFGFTADGKYVLAFNGDKILKISLDNGDVVSLTRPDGVFLEYNDETGILLMVEVDDPEYTYKTINALYHETTQYLPAPENYSPVYMAGRHFNRNEVSLSPDGRFLAISDLDREKLIERLWIVDIETNTWQAVIENDAKIAPDNVLWATDQRYIAWYSVVLDSNSDYYLDLFFIETEDYQITRSFSIEKVRRPPKILGWIKTVNGQDRFGIFVPDHGVVLIDPINALSDINIVSYEVLNKIIPIDPNDINVWRWESFTR